MSALTSTFKDKNILRLLVILIVVLGVATALKGTMFFNIGNFQSMGKQFPEFGILALAMAFTLYTAGIDLSVVAVANLSAVLIAKFLLANAGPDGNSAMILLVAFALALLIGAICGMINGLLIGGMGIAPILATLGTNALYTGAAIVLTNGSTIGGLPRDMATFINSNAWGVPVPVIIFAVFAFISAFILSRTTLGNKLRMLGTSVRAVTFSGFSTLKLYTVNYMLSAMLSAMAGMIMLGRFNSAKADYGESYLMQCILIAVLGGMDPNGGRGTMRGVVIAVLIVQVLSSWINMYEALSSFYTQIVWGVLLIFVLIYNYYITEREKKRAMRA